MGVQPTIHVLSTTVPTPLQNLQGRNVPNNQDIIDATEQIKSEMKAAFMLRGGHDATHKQLKGHLENAYVVGREDKYPTDTADLLSMMNNFCSIRSHTPQQKNISPGQGVGVDGRVNFMRQGEEK